ncbi:MAG TPA: hypothetical protein VGJ81_02530 [Thermoanaerobaculia bacterium]|jgi:hypothetical protein
MTGRPRVAFVAVIVIALAIGIASWTRLPHEGLPTLSFDGFRYLAGAYSIRDHHVYRDTDGSPQRVWPPGTSFLYAAASVVTGRPPENLPGAIDICAYLVAMLAFAVVLARTVRHSWIASIAFVALACNSFIVSMTNKLWSDPPALALFLVALALLAGTKPSLRSVVLAAAAIAIGVAFRYAMISALILPLFVVWRMRTRWFAPVAGSCAAVMLVVVANRLSGLHPLPLRNDLRAFGMLTVQVLPSQIGLVGLLAVAAAVLISARALPIAGVWIAAYIAFLFVAQAFAHPSFTLDLRILILLYPAIVLAIAVAADKASNPWLKGCLAALLVIAAGRALHGVVPHPIPSPTCVTREQLTADLKTKSIAPDAPLSSNAQGLVWYALRRPVSAHPGPGDIVIAVDPARVCEGVVETALPDVARTRRIALP